MSKGNKKIGKRLRKRSLFLFVICSECVNYVNIFQSCVTLGAYKYLSFIRLEFHKLTNPNKSLFI